MASRISFTTLDGILDALCMGWLWRLASGMSEVLIMPVIQRLLSSGHSGHRYVNSTGHSSQWISFSSGWLGHLVLSRIDTTCVHPSEYLSHSFTPPHGMMRYHSCSFVLLTFIVTFRGLRARPLLSWTSVKRKCSFLLSYLASFVISSQNPFFVGREQWRLLESGSHLHC